MTTKAPKRLPKTRRTSKPDDPEEFARFVEAAQKAGVDETGEAFEQAFDKIVTSRRPAQKRPHH
jgi:hypothetical protein